MNEWEQEMDDRLRALYRDEEPPQALGDRIVAQARRQVAQRGPRLTPILGLCAGLVLTCVLVGVPWMHRRRVEQRHAAEAQAQLMYALQITTSELDWAEARIDKDIDLRGGKP